VAIVIPLEGDVTMLAPLGDSFRLEPETWIKDVRPWNPTFWKMPKLTYENLLIKVIKEKKLDTKRIGIEEDVLLWSTRQMLSEELPKAKFKNATNAMYGVMVIKDEEEIELCRHAAAMTDNGVYAALEIMKPGITEYDLAGAADYAMRKSGAEMYYAPTTISADYRLGPDHSPTERLLQKGDIVKMDFHPVYKNYRADRMTVTVLGKPPAEFKKMCDVIAAGTQAMLQASVPGKTGADIDKAFNKAIEKGGYKNLDTTWYLGHGIGTGHLPPFIHPDDQTVLKPNMVIILNPLIFRPGIHSFMLEFMLRVTEDKPELLNKTPLDLIVLE
jgi:Xaa-Pro aminopeptidase